MSESALKRRDLVLMTIALCAEKPEFGRTSLQKLVYFISQYSESNFGYKAHFYGPFSEGVEEDVEALVLAGLVDEAVRKFGINGRHYEYRITNEGRERVSGLEGAYPSDCNRIGEMVKKIEESVGSLNQSVLSTAAKTHYIAANEGKAIRIADVPNIGRQFGWEM